ncbi:MAG: DEAD/DEAH box helicase family protein [Solirubrobacterales bacterium]|nr:DEAD/DEAH box helicase family protein [Solirubrobacterales bacterium]MCB8970350.1 DEAD/DEAH box helicase family protein [Thermoleophilales bacterium]
MPPASTATAPSPLPAAFSDDRLRAWQREALAEANGWIGGPFLIAAAPGAGKTRPALVLAAELLRQRQIDRVAVVCPTAPLTRQWAAAAAGVGLSLQPDSQVLRTTRDFQGIAVTYARAAASAKTYGAECTARTLVIADEVHHLGDELAWGAGFVKAFGRAGRKLLLSGTPFRSDDAPIPGIRYDGEGFARPDVSYSYAESVRDGACRPIAFIPFDGTLVWQSGDKVIESSFEEEVSTKERGRRYRTAISVDLAEGLPRILRQANDQLSRVRASGHADAGGLVIAADSDHARLVAGSLKDITGESPTVVLHQDAGAHRRLREFSDGNGRWIVAVNMVSEGVDIPRLRVGVYATTAKTAMIFRQIVGRFVRTGSGTKGESWLFLPAEPILRSHASRIEDEIARVARPGADEDGLLDEREERRETERSDEPDFVAVAADIAPQMNLFGEAGDDSVQPIAAPVPEAAEALDDGEPAVPAFQRRKDLRARRHRLIGDLALKRGWTHREANVWINEETGVGRVEEATIEELERSCRVLSEELFRPKRRRRRSY